MTKPINPDALLEIVERIGGLSDEQRRAILFAYRLSGPSGDYFAAECEDHLDTDIAHPATGRLTNLGLAIRKRLVASCYKGANQ